MSRPIQKVKIDSTPDALTASVFSCERTIKLPNIKLPKDIQFNKKLKMDGLVFLSKLPTESIAVAFLDPQYRGVLDKLAYGNEGKGRGKARCSMPQMTEEVINDFICGIDNVLVPTGHLFLWIDKFHLCTGFTRWLTGSTLDVVDMLTWDKGHIGMGYRTRRISEHIIVLQKQPRRAKGIWKIHNIPDVWRETVKKNGHTHKKPIDLQGELIAAVSNDGDIVIDPAAGSFSVLEACKLRKRNFLGCEYKN